MTRSVRQKKDTCRETSKFQIGATFLSDRFYNSNICISYLSQMAINESRFTSFCLTKLVSDANLDIIPHSATVALRSERENKRRKMTRLWYESVNIIDINIRIHKYNICAQFVLGIAKRVEDLRAETETEALHDLWSAFRHSNTQLEIGIIEICNGRVSGYL